MRISDWSSDVCSSDLSMVDDAGERFALLAQNLEGSIATVFRQVSMNRFEDAVHTHRREHGELSVEDFGDHWTRTQGDLFGDAMDVSAGYRSWWRDRKSKRLNSSH